MAEKPKRIQRKRTKGWRMPPNTIYVGRPGVWGNPYGADERGLALFRNSAQGIWDASIIADWGDQIVRINYERHLKWLNRFTGPHPLDAMRSVLRGKDLACWCKIGAPCHADILLELANR